MPEVYDAVVIGAGHNGLTCACYLARAGLSVVAIDQYHTVGGMTTTEEITLPGFRSDLHAFGYQFANLSPVPRELGLASFGFELIRPEISFSQVFPDGGNPVDASIGCGNGSQHRPLFQTGWGDLAGTGGAVRAHERRDRDLDAQPATDGRCRDHPARRAPAWHGRYPLRIAEHAILDARAVRRRRDPTVSRVPSRPMPVLVPTT